MPNLFTHQSDAPLAKRLRPHALDEAIGQHHLSSMSKPLQVAGKGDQLYFMLLRKVASLGKISLVHILIQSFNTLFQFVFSVFSCIKGIRGTTKKTKPQPKRVPILFTEQTHHLNKFINQDINQLFIENIMQFLAFFGYSMRKKHG